MCICTFLWNLALISENNVIYDKKSWLNIWIQCKNFVSHCFRLSWASSALYFHDIALKVWMLCVTDLHVSPFAFVCFLFPINLSFICSFFFRIISLLPCYSFLCFLCIKSTINSTISKSTDSFFSILFFLMIFSIGFAERKRIEAEQVATCIA